MAKVGKISSRDGSVYLCFECPGCGCLHQVKTPMWNFNGDFDKPTLQPSVLVRGGNKGNDFICHSFVTDGKIQFLDDCSHDLKGQTVEIPEWES